MLAIHNGSSCIVTATVSPKNYRLHGMFAYSTTQGLLKIWTEHFLKLQTTKWPSRKAKRGPKLHPSAVVDSMDLHQKKLKKFTSSFFKWGVKTFLCSLEIFFYLLMVNFESSVHFFRGPCTQCNEWGEKISEVTFLFSYTYIWNSNIFSNFQSFVAKVSREIADV